jgi:hypothetical protein
VRHDFFAHTSSAAAAAAAAADDDDDPCSKKSKPAAVSATQKPYRSLLQLPMNLQQAALKLDRHEHFACSAA